jgi:hypothetical protein
VHLSADAKFENAEKVVTTNISDRGCFVYSIRKWTTGDRVWLRFLGDDEDICGTVCSWRQWGNNKAMPGIGIKLNVALNNEDPGHRSVKQRGFEQRRVEQRYSTLRSLLGRKQVVRKRACPDPMVTAPPINHT